MEFLYALWLLAAIFAFAFVAMTDAGSVQAQTSLAEPEGEPVTTPRQAGDGVASDQLAGDRLVQIFTRHPVRLKPDIAAREQQGVPALAAFVDAQSKPALSLRAPTIEFPDFKSVRADIARGEFLGAEAQALNAYTTASVGARGQRKIDLVTLYLAYDYNAEGLALLEKSDHGAGVQALEQDMLTVLRTLARFGVGRYRDIINDHDTEVLDLVHPLRAMALCALGQYENAWALFAQTGSTPILPPSLLPDYYLHRAITATALGEIGYGREALRALGSYQLSDDQQAARVYLMQMNVITDMRAKGVAGRGEVLAGLARLPMPWRGLAVIDRIAFEAEAGEITLATARDQLEQVSLEWRGGAFERRVRFLRAQMADQAGDRLAAFAGYRRVIGYAPKTAYAERSIERLQAMMLALFAPEDQTPIMEATRLFYDNIDLLAPGAVGDAQIRTISQRLVALDLLEEAAELLDHQVFQRLRGVERSKVAVDLAKIYLRAREPVKALRVIRSTRITGLSSMIIAERRAVEATALWKSGQHGRALARLDLAGDQRLAPSTIYLRAMIELDMGDFTSAARTLFAIARHTIENNETLTREHEALILQMVAAAVRAQDIGKVETIRTLMETRFDDHPVTAIIATLSPDGAPDEFLTAYRNWLASYQLEPAVSGI